MLTTPLTPYVLKIYKMDIYIIRYVYGFEILLFTISLLAATLSKMYFIKKYYCVSHGYCSQTVVQRLLLDVLRRSGCRHYLQGKWEQKNYDEIACR